MSHLFTVLLLLLFIQSSFSQNRSEPIEKEIKRIDALIDQTLKEKNHLYDSIKTSCEQFVFNNIDSVRMHFKKVEEIKKQELLDLYMSRNFPVLLPKFKSLTNDQPNKLLLKIRK